MSDSFIVTALIVPVSNIPVGILMIGILKWGNAATVPQVIARELFRIRAMVAATAPILVSVAGKIHV